MGLNSGLSVRLQRAAFLLSLTYAVGLKPQPMLSWGPRIRENISVMTPEEGEGGQQGLKWGRTAGAGGTRRRVADGPGGGGRGQVMGGVAHGPW